MEYTDKHIQSLDIFDHVRLRSTAYVPDTNVEGQFGVIKEILDNSLDELENIQQPVKKLTVCLFYHNDQYIILIKDNGRGIPLNKLEDVFTKPFTSGKFNTKAYKTSSGLLGIGAKASIALSSKSKVISYRKEGIKSIYFWCENNKIKYQSSDIQSNMLNVSGSVTIIQPDISIFQNIPEIIKSKELETTIIEYFSCLSLFNKDFEIEFYIKNINFDIFSKDNDYYWNIEATLNASELKFNNKIFDRIKFLERYFETSFYINQQPSFNLNFNNDKLDYNASLIYIPSTKDYNRLQNNNKITFVNNILIKDNESYHIRYLISTLKEYLAKFIQDTSLKEFFLKQYKFPFIFLIYSKFSGAQFTGTTKHSFRDNKFKSTFLPLLKSFLNQNSQLLEDMYELLSEHIVVQYNKFYNKALSVKNSKKILLELNRPDKFDDCLTKDRLQAELFLVEGDSAKSVAGRDPEYQAIYTLGGKTLNALIELGKENKSLEKLKKNIIFQDIIKLLNIVPGSNDISNINFGKILILTDADTHGYHIASILANNLRLLCPKLIDEGMVYLVEPPLYSIKFKSINKKLYLRSDEDLVTMLSMYIYWECIRLALKGEHFDSPKELSKEEFIYFINMVFKIGYLLEDISKEINIHPIIIECLCEYSYILNKLVLTEEDIEMLKSCKVWDNIVYDSKSHLLIISQGLNDYIVPLVKFTDVLYKKILPVFRKIGWPKLKLYVRGIEQNSYIPATIIQLYEYLKTFEKLYTIERYKGVGSMSIQDRQESCMDRNNRIVRQIKGVGDIDVIYGMLGNNADYRKRELMTYL